MVLALGRRKSVVSPKRWTRTEKYWNLRTSLKWSGQKLHLREGPSGLDPGLTTCRD